MVGVATEEIGAELFELGGYDGLYGTPHLPLTEDYIKGYSIGFVDRYVKALGRPGGIEDAFLAHLIGEMYDPRVPQLRERLHAS